MNYFYEYPYAYLKNQVGLVGASYPEVWCCEFPHAAATGCFIVLLNGGRFAPENCYFLLA
jgi:hypothetical protein